MDPEKRVQQIAYILQKEGYALAFVEDHGRVYYSLFSKDSLDPSSSAIVQLLQGLFGQFVDNSFFILRRRLYTTEEISAKEEGMIRVVAKRARSKVKAVNHGLNLSDLEFIKIEFSRQQALAENHLGVFNLSLPENLRGLAFKTDQERWDFVTQLAELNPRGLILHDYDRPVAAALWNSRGELLSYGINSSSRNKTLHAEINLVQSFCAASGGPLPEGGTLFVTHKPCRMCAGMIYDCSANPFSMQIKYLIEEKGRLSRNTILDQKGLNYFCGVSNIDMAKKLLRNVDQLSDFTAATRQ